MVKKSIAIRFFEPLRPQIQTLVTHRKTSRPTPLLHRKDHRPKANTKIRRRSPSRPGRNQMKEHHVDQKTCKYSQPDKSRRQVFWEMDRTLCPKLCCIVVVFVCCQLFFRIVPKTLLHDMLKSKFAANTSCASGRLQTLRKTAFAEFLSLRPRKLS